MARVTQSDLAQELGVSAMTVSLALRGHRSIPEATRKRVLALAEQRGFRIDPIMSELGRMRWKRSQPVFHGTIAFLIPDAKNAIQGYMHEGTLAQALESQLKTLSYGLNVFGLDEYPDPEALARVLHRRGIVGLMHTRLPGETWMDLFPWHQFVSVALNYGHSPAPQHAVLLERFPNWLELWSKLAERGYRRPGLIAFDEPDAEDYLVNEAGRLQASRLVYGTEPLDPFLLPVRGAFNSPHIARKLKNWYRQGQPDCLIGFNEFVLEWALERMPQEWSGGCCCWCLSGTPGRWSGFIEKVTETVREAVHLLHNQLRDGLIQGTRPALKLIIPRPWHEGESLPPRTGGKPPKRRRDPLKRHYPFTDQ